MNYNMFIIKLFTDTLEAIISSHLIVSWTSYNTADRLRKGAITTLTDHASPLRYFLNLNRTSTTVTT